MVGINGSIGQGKSYFSREIVSRLNALMTPEEGQAVTRSIDDYYLTKAKRYAPAFLALGYNPPGISNRGPAGTHDLDRLRHDLGALEKSQMGGKIELPTFDKATDDRDPKPTVVQGKVGVFILEGWFVGAQTEADPSKADPGLKRSVAQALAAYKPVFDRLDALWAFEPPASREDMVAQRLEQERTTHHGTGSEMLTREQIRRMVDYFYKDSWQKGVTSPFPLRKEADFWATTDRQHRFVKIGPRWP